MSDIVELDCQLRAAIRAIQRLRSQLQMRQDEWHKELTAKYVAQDKIAELEAALAPLAKVGQLIKDTTPPGIATHSLLYSPAAGLEYSLNSQHALDAYAALNKEQS